MAAGPATPPRDPAAAMTEAEQIASHERIWQAYEAKYREWLDQTLAAGVDFSRLQRVEFNVSSSGPAATLREALTTDAIATIESELP
jgi:hypothetical protein